MKRLTNLQMSVIVNKIYNELDKEIQAINTKRLESVDMDKVLEEDSIHPLLKKIELLEEEKDSLEKIIKSIEDTVKERMGMSRYYTIPTYDKYVNSLKRKEANLININKEEIEASVILSDVEDLDSLIKSIKKSMSKNIPELND